MTDYSKLKRYRDVIEAQRQLEGMGFTASALTDEDENVTYLLQDSAIADSRIVPFVLIVWSKRIAAFGENYCNHPGDEMVAPLALFWKGDPCVIGSVYRHLGFKMWWTGRDGEPLFVGTSVMNPPRIYGDTADMPEYIPGRIASETGVNLLTRYEDGEAITGQIVSRLQDHGMQLLGAMGDALVFDWGQDPEARYFVTDHRTRMAFTVTRQRPTYEQVRQVTYVDCQPCTLEAMVYIILCGVRNEPPDFSSPIVGVPLILRNNVPAT